MSDGNYAQNYYRRAVTETALEKPDTRQANGHREILETLYDAHHNGGPEGARAAWEMIKRVRPEARALESAGGMLIHASELKYITKPQVQLDGYPFYKFGLNLLVGSSGAGKSFVALDYGGRVAQERSVVYIVGEGLHGYLARWEAWKAYNNAGDGFMWFHKEPVQMIDDQSLNTFLELIGPKQPELIIVDTVARCAVGIEENSAKEVGVFVEACDHLRRELNCGVLLVHHTGKDGKQRGSSALYAACDAVLMQTKSDGRIMLANNSDQGGKNKHEQEAATRYVKIVPYAVGEHQGAVVMDVKDVIDRPEHGLSITQRQILTALHAFDRGLSGRALMDATNLSHATVYRVLNALIKGHFLEQTEDERYVITELGREAVD